MGKRLTNNARWIIALTESVPDKSGIPVKSLRICHNLERHSWNELESQVVADYLDLSRCMVVGTYLVDVALYPYARDWREVSRIAEKWFINQKMLPREYAQYQEFEL